MQTVRGNRLRRIAALSLTGFAAFSLVWLYLPPPLYALWLLEVAATEWGVWFGLLGLAGGLAGTWGLRRSQEIVSTRSGRWLDGLAVLLGAFAALSALNQYWRAENLAVNAFQMDGLSLPSYLFDTSPSDGANVSREEIVFATVGGQTLRLDHYETQKRKLNSRPAIIVIHGGSWDAGDKSDFLPWDRWLACLGGSTAVFDIQYRTHPQPNWRESVGDVKTAIGWVRRNANHYDIDPNRITLLGRSAGGQLALLAAYSTGDPALPPSDGSKDTPVHDVIAFYPPTDLTWGYDHPPHPDVLDVHAKLRAFLGGTPTTVPEAYRLASPIAHVRPGLPRTLLLHGDRDLIVMPRHSDMLAARLHAAGVPCTVYHFPDAVHGFDYHFGSWDSQMVRAAIRYHFL